MHTYDQRAGINFWCLRARFDFDHMGQIKFRYDLVSLLVFNLELNMIPASVGLDLFKTHELLVGWLKLVHITHPPEP